jgi:hypothetical protein
MANEWSDAFHGHTPNYINPSHRGADLAIVAYVTSAVAAFVLVARFYTRSRLVGLVNVSDWLMLVALVCNLISFRRYLSPRNLTTKSSEEMLTVYNR